jgi:general stress protein CsbA
MSETVSAVAAGARTRSLPLWLPLLALLGAGVAGAAAADQPKLLLGGAVALCVLVLAFRMPVANLTLLLFLTAVVPFQVLNRFSVGGGLNSPGLLFSDVFLLAGLAWAALALPNVPLDRRRYLYSLAMLLFLALVAVQFVHGLRAGDNRSIVGQEGRVLLGFGTFLIALPLLAHAPSRRRLLGALAAVALALGAWGMVQWLGHFSFGAAGDVGVREGVRLTSGGGGQLQGGEFGFPAALVVCFAALTLGDIRSRLWRAVLVVAIALNAASCLVTFERSFWLDALVGLGFVLGFVLVFAPVGRRVKVLAVLASAAVLGVGALSAVSPQTLTTAHQRLNSIGGYATDSSVRYRVVESRFVFSRIRAHPVAGSGLGATIFWGQPWAQVSPKTRNYSHNGYLWLAWKLGIPAAALLTVLLVLAVFGRAGPREEPLSLAVRRGAQGAILGLLLATITFPSFSQLSIAPVMGLLLALAVSPLLRTPEGGVSRTAQAKAFALSR